MKKNHISAFLTLFVVCFLVCSPAYAFEMTVTDAEGNKTVMESIDRELLGDLASTPSFMLNAGSNVPAPHPQEAAFAVPGLAESIQENGGFYEACCVLCIDFGPNWETVLEENGSNKSISGRYNYLFVGKYNADSGLVEDTNGNNGRGKYTYYSAMDTLEVAEPYAWVSYDLTNDSLDIVTNTYDRTYGSTLTLSDVYLWGDESGAYPYVFSFQDDVATMLEWNGVSSFSTGIDSFAWDYYEDVPGEEPEEPSGGTNVDLTETNRYLYYIQYYTEIIKDQLLDIYDRLYDIYTRLGEMPGTIVELFQKNFNDLISAINYQGSEIRKWLEDIYNTSVEMLDAIKNLDLDVDVEVDDGKSLLDYLIDFLTPAAIFFGSLVDSVLDGILDAAEFAANLGSDVLDFLGSALLQFIPVLTLIVSLGVWLVTLFGFLPPEFAGFISAMVGILIAGILIKIALNVK